MLHTTSKDPTFERQMRRIACHKRLMQQRCNRTAEFDPRIVGNDVLKVAASTTNLKTFTIVKLEGVDETIEFVECKMTLRRRTVGVATFLIDPHIE